MKRLFQANQGPQPGANPPLSASPLASLDSNSCILGKLSFGGDAYIGGVVIGDIRVNGTLTIAESGRVTSPIRATSVIIAGKVTGDIVALDRIEVRRTAKVFGNLTAHVLLIEAGAVLEGCCSTRSAHHPTLIRIGLERDQMGFPFLMTGEGIIPEATIFAGATIGHPNR
jgi:cytoskeletal protein CcmA (bactofilin family)